MPRGVGGLTLRKIPEQGSALFSAFGLGLVAQLRAWWNGSLPAMIIVPGLLQLAPGFLGTEVVLRQLRSGPGAAGADYSSVFLVSLEITLGLLLAAAIKMTTRGVRSDAQ